MKKTQLVTKISKKKEPSKQLISKIYFSRTQEGYLKKYGCDNHYIQELGQLMSRVCKKKLSKIIEEVKQNNTVFRKYLQKKHITKLKIDDVIEFQGTLEMESRKVLQFNNHPKNDNNIKHLNNDIIRIGFMMIFEKLSDDRLNGFISESKYLKEILEREQNNLNRLGFDYVGVEHPQKARNVLQEIRLEQKLNGSFKLISSKIREETATIFEVSNCLKSIIGK